MRPLIVVAAGALALLSGCPKGPPSSLDPSGERENERAALQPEVAQLSTQAQALLERQDALVWKNWTEGTAADIASTYQGADPLFSAGNIQKIDRLRALTEDPREVRALTNLSTYFVGEYLSREIDEIQRAISNLEASLTFTANGREYAYRELERALAAEKELARRRAIYDGATPVVERLGESIRRKEERLQQLLAQLGYPSYEAFGAELRQVEIDRLAALCEEVLQATQAPYTEVMGRLATRELGLSLESLRRADLPRLFRLKAADSQFPKAQVVPRTGQTLEALGLALSGVPQLTVDLRDAPSKNPRPLTLAVKIPSDVRLAFTPTDGLRAQGNLLHEVGHALHFSLTQEPRFELSKLGNATLGEGYAHLFEDLTADPVWLTEVAQLAPESQSDTLNATSAYRLFLIRRTAGNLLYQIQLRRLRPPNPRELYGQVMARTYLLPITDADLARDLVDLEDFYDSADLFRAWFLAGQLQGQLKARFGPAWWKAPEAGTFLRGLWAKGNAPSPRELSLTWGEDGVVPDVLLLRLASTLGVTLRLPAARPSAPTAPQPGPDAGTPATPPAP